MQNYDNQHHPRFGAPEIETGRLSLADQNLSLRMPKHHQQLSQQELLTEIINQRNSIIQARTQNMLNPGFQVPNLNMNSNTRLESDSSMETSMRNPKRHKSNSYRDKEKILSINEDSRLEKNYSSSSHASIVDQENLASSV